MRVRVGAARIVTILLAAALFALSCGSTAKGNDAYGERSAVQMQGSSVTINMKDIQFQPKGIKVDQQPRMTPIVLCATFASCR